MAALRVSKGKAAARPKSLGQTVWSDDHLLRIDFFPKFGQNPSTGWEVCHINIYTPAKNTPKYMYSRLFIIKCFADIVYISTQFNLLPFFLGGGLSCQTRPEAKTFFLYSWSYQLVFGFFDARPVTLATKSRVESISPFKAGGFFHTEFPHWPLYSSIIFLTSVNNKGCKPCPAGFTKASKISRMAGGTSLEVSFFTSGSSPSVLTSLKANLPLP